MTRRVHHFFGTPTSGRLRLYLTGFGRQNIVPMEGIIAALEALPAHHLAGLYGIRYDPRRETQSLLSHYLGQPIRRTSRAQFLGLSNTISVYAFRSREECFQTLYHEIGHHVFYGVIGSRLKKIWVTELYPGSGHVSDYAATNATEDFAESYAAYLLKPAALLRLSAKHVFMRDRVFRLPSRAEIAQLDVRI
jgi:hypothetical protein